ncbi:MAG: RNA methyltransferase [Deltaproteobacteria bacterium]|nr:RNA methyltransferase [Deltaproteobacteria bacterium]
MSGLKTNPQVAVILVQPMYSGNLGSVARAMKNMGLAKLLLVNPTADPAHQDAKNMAVGAKDILQKAVYFNSLPAAIKDFQLVIGTSRRRRKLKRNWIDPKHMVALVRALPNKARAALVFGHEESGLSNEDLDVCHYVMEIPSHKNFPSLNLAAAVLLVAYELFTAEVKPQNYKPGLLPKISSGQLEEMFADLQQTLQSIDFFKGKNPLLMMRPLREIFQRAALSQKEIKIIRGICRKVRWVKAKLGSRP